MHRINPFRPPYNIAIIYAIVGVLWIILSDIFLSYIINGSDEILFLAQLKGIGFVMVTAIILFFLIKRHYAIIQDRQNDLNLLFNQGNLGLIKAAPDGRIEFISKELCESLGYHPRELIGTMVQELTHPADLAYDLEIVNRLERAEITNYVYDKRYLKKNTNEPLWVTLNGTVQRKNGEISRYVIAVQDLTQIHEERRKANLEVREKRALINSTHDIIWSVDNEGKLVSFNDAFESLVASLGNRKIQRGDFGLIEKSESFELSKRWKTYYKQAGTHGRYSMVERVQINDEARSFEITFHPIIEDKKVLGVSCFGRDITDLVKTENSLRKALQQLEESTRFTQLALNRLPIGVAMNEIDTGKVTFWNDQFTNIYGIDMNTVSDVGEFFSQVYPDPERRKQIQQRILTDIESGLPERMMWNGIEIRSKKELTYVNAMNIPLPEQNLMISTVIDVTSDYQHLKTIEDQNERLKKIAWHQSHMVRSKLTNVISLITLIQQDASKGMHSIELLERLEVAAHEFDLSVREVTDLTKRLTDR